MYEELWEGSEQLQLTARRYASESDSVQLGNFASPPAAATVLQNFGDSPQHTTSDMSTNTMFVDDMHFEPPGPSSPPPPEYHDFLQGIVLGLQSDTDSLVTAQQSLEHQQQQVPPIMAPADPSASETSESFDDVNIEDLFMEADTLVAATQGDIIAASLPQQVPTAASLAALDQTGSAQLDVRHQSSTPDSIHHQSAPSSVQVRRAGEKRKSRRASPLARADVPSISPALSQTRHGWPARKRRSEDESSAAQPNAAPTAHPTLPETARLRPAKRQKVAQSSSANKARVPDATPARKRVVKRAARPPSSFPELSQQEIAQARADGMVWARLGSYEAWPAQVGPTPPTPVNVHPAA